MTFNILSDILAGIYFEYFDRLPNILSGIYSVILSGILSDFFCGAWLRPSNAHWDLELAVENPAAH